MLERTLARKKGSRGRESPFVCSRASDNVLRTMPTVGNDARTYPFQGFASTHCEGLPVLLDLAHGGIHRVALVLRIVRIVTNERKKLMSTTATTIHANFILASLAAFSVLLLIVLSHPTF